MRLLGKGAHAHTHLKFSPAVAMQTMHGIMQARLAASAKLTLTVASETGQPPTAALTAILLAVRFPQQPMLSYAFQFFACKSGE